MALIDQLPLCAWCREQFTPRQGGGREQRFCKRRCRQNLHQAHRAIGKLLHECEIIDLDDLKGVLAGRHQEILYRITANPNLRAR